VFAGFRRRRLDYRRSHMAGILQFGPNEPLIEARGVTWLSDRSVREAERSQLRLAGKVEDAAISEVSIPERVEQSGTAGEHLGFDQVGDVIRRRFDNPVLCTLRSRIDPGRRGPAFRIALKRHPENPQYALHCSMTE